MISQRDRGEYARFYTVTDPKKHQKGYTVYKVTARITVWKRYSDFRKLHQNLWQLHRNVCSQLELFPPFARAKVFGRFDDSVIEERRQCSEDLLQFSAMSFAQLQRKQKNPHKNTYFPVLHDWFHFFFFTSLHLSPPPLITHVPLLCHSIAGSEKEQRLWVD
uniref:PX domain-containing protein n=1 Tax=Mola mola TaxID=94237 RepID=A0A3Q3WS08_MOLML